MTGFVPILVICLIAGLAFAFFAFLTARYAANTLTTQADPTKIQINEHLSISTGNAVVALFIMSVIVAGAVPAYWLYLDSGRVDTPITFEADNIDPLVPSVTIASRDFGSSQVLRLPLFRSGQMQHFKVTPTPEFDAFDLDAYYDWTAKSFMVKVNHHENHVVPVQSGYARMDDPIKLTKAKLTGKVVTNDANISSAKGRSASDAMRPDPAGVPPS